MRFLERRLPSVWELARPIGGAALVAFALDLLLQPPRDLLALAGLLLAYPAGVGFALLIGYWLGRYAWPRRGRHLAHVMLRRAAEGRKRPVLILTGRPDFDVTLARRVLEVIGFAAGVSIIVPAVLQLADAPPGVVQVVGASITVFALWASFVLVPYWLFARLGIRKVDPVRWMVQPLSLAYAERLRLSNGALLLIAAGAAANLALRAGASGDEALLEGVITVTRLVASILVVATAGIVMFLRVEKELARELEEEAFRVGVRDGRGMTDGEFLPALQAPPSPASP